MRTAVSVAAVLVEESVESGCFMRTAVSGAVREGRRQMVNTSVGCRYVSITAVPDERFEETEQEGWGSRIRSKMISRCSRGKLKVFGSSEGFVGKLQGKCNDLTGRQENSAMQKAQ
jgi:hypothetical protein